MTQQEIEQQIAALKREKELKQQPLADEIVRIKREQQSNAVLAGRLHTRVAELKMQHTDAAAKVTAIIREYDEKIAALNAQKAELIKEAPATTSILANGVYLVAPDDSYEMFTPDAHPVPGTRVGISWDGHRWLLGKDYGKLPWTEASEDDLATEAYGIMSEYKAVLDWNVFTADYFLRKFFGHIPFAPDEMMPTCPMVIVQEHLAKNNVLNDALVACGMPEYESGDNRWFVERCTAHSPRFFNGYSGSLNLSGVRFKLRVQAVIPWNI